jgi:hypothetical protein
MEKITIGGIYEDDLCHDVDEVVFEARDKGMPVDPYREKYYLLWCKLNGLLHSARHYALTRKDGDKTSDEISCLVHSLYQACLALGYDWRHYGKGFEDVDMLAWIENEDLVDGDGYVDEEEDEYYESEEEYEE